MRVRAELGQDAGPKLILSFVRQNNSVDEQAFIEHWKAIADKIHITDLHNWAGTLNTESDVNYPCYRPVADLHRAVGRPGLALLRRLRRPHHPRRPQHLDASRTSGTPSHIGTPDVCISRAAGPTSAAPATCRARTRRSGSPSSPEPLTGATAVSLDPCAARGVYWIRSPVSGARAMNMLLRFALATALALHRRGPGRRPASCACRWPTAA